MKKETIIALLAVLVLALGVAACGGGDKTEATAEKAAAEHAMPEAQVAETHDCDGGCGMTAVPMDKLTEINGKYYCAGCAKKVQEEGGESHEGHDHG
ncbi:hypothetical protein KDM41_03505 [bacterium]|nr:hypothetical protein [bacterium]